MPLTVLTYATSFSLLTHPYSHVTATTTDHSTYPIYSTVGPSSSQPSSSLPSFSLSPPPSLQPSTPTLTRPLHPFPLIIPHSPLLPFPLFLGSALLTLTQPTHTHGDPRRTCPHNQQDAHVRATHGMGQITHGTDHIAVHLKMCLSELICPLPHCDLLTSHLQTLAFWRRNHNDMPTLSQRTCPHARTHPDISLARVFPLLPPGL